MSDEVRVTSATGGQKGRKQAQLGALHPGALYAVAEVAGFGTEKYERYNFLRGYDWSLSYDALQRHLMQFWMGQDIDDESGHPHLAHAAWHCLALLAFLIEDIGSDDRPIVEDTRYALGANPDPIISATLQEYAEQLRRKYLVPPSTPYENAMYCREFES